METGLKIFGAIILFLCGIMFYQIINEHQGTIAYVFGGIVTTFAFFVNYKFWFNKEEDPKG